VEGEGFDDLLRKMMDNLPHIPDPVLLQVFDIALQQAFTIYRRQGLGMMVRPGLERVQARRPGSSPWK